MNESSREPDFFPTATLAVLQLRSQMLDWVRQFFRERSYWEVETPLLSHDVCIDAWLEPFHVEVNGSTFYLQTSPEFAMKRLLAAGARSIFQVTRAFRQEECGRLHNPEFTIVEWYRVGDNYHQQMDFVEHLAEGFHQRVAELLRFDDVTNVPDGEAGIGSLEDLLHPACRLTYEDAFRRALGDGVLSKSMAELRALANKHGISGPSSLSDDDRDGWLNLMLSETVEPMLKELGTVFLYDYPASQAALARIRHTETPVAERFELYIDGVEICNGYQELTDPEELRKRQKEQSRQRQAEGLKALPQRSRLLDAMDAGLPECSGVALGFDRLLLSALRSSSLDDVTAFPFDRA